jgi:hypothetical protein
MDSIAQPGFRKRCDGYEMFRMNLVEYDLGEFHVIHCVITIESEDIDVVFG